MVPSVRISNLMVGVICVPSVRISILMFGNNGTSLNVGIISVCVCE